LSQPNAEDDVNRMPSCKHYKSAGWSKNEDSLMDAAGEGGMGALQDHAAGLSFKRKM